MNGPIPLAPGPLAYGTRNSQTRAPMRLSEAVTSFLGQNAILFKVFHHIVLKMNHPKMHASIPTLDILVLCKGSTSMFI